VLGGCSTGSSVKTSSVQSTSAISSSSQNVSATMPESMKKALELTDQESMNNLAGLDLNVMDYNKYAIGEKYDFTFDNSKNISSEMLFVFFNYITSGVCREYPDDYNLKWYDNKEKKFHIPVTDIVTVLNNYFDVVNFNPVEINGYNSKAKTIDEIIDGFGGANYPKFIKKELISRDVLRITIRYYDSDEYNNVKYTKEYTIRYTDNGYKYLSIKKQ
jgi:hypothetical protein